MKLFYSGSVVELNKYHFGIKYHNESGREMRTAVTVVLTSRSGGAEIFYASEASVLAVRRFELVEPKKGDKTKDKRRDGIAPRQLVPSTTCTVQAK